MAEHMRHVSDVGKYDRPRRAGSSTYIIILVTYQSNVNILQLGRSVETDRTVHASMHYSFHRLDPKSTRRDVIISWLTWTRTPVSRSLDPVAWASFNEAKVHPH